MEPNRKIEARKWSGMFLFMGSTILAAWGLYGLSLIPPNLIIPLEWSFGAWHHRIDTAVWILFLAPVLILLMALFTRFSSAWLPLASQKRRFIWLALALIVLLCTVFQYMIIVKALELAGVTSSAG